VEHIEVKRVKTTWLKTEKVETIQLKVKRVKIA